METTQTTHITPTASHSILTEHSTHTLAESKDLSTGFYVASFLILLLILGIFGDMFVFILGLIGAVTIYAGYFTEKAANEEHH